jgi:hypothetical protein
MMERETVQHRIERRQAEEQLSLHPQAQARLHREALEAERRDIKGPSYLDVKVAEAREKNEWKVTLPFYLRPWFWIVLAAVSFSIPPVAPFGLMALIGHAIWYHIARGKVTEGS